jgi:amino acid adenylation domain-containing protein
MSSDQTKWFPLTASQRQMYSAQMLDPESPLYNTVITNTLNGNICKQAFSDAWNTAVSENPSLSIQILEIGGEPKQTFSVLQDSLQIIDFSSHSDAQKTAEQWMEEASLEIFQLDKVLFTAALLKLSTQKWIWFCNQHHLITDALSFQSLWQQISNNYLKNIQVLPDAAAGQSKGASELVNQVGSFADYLAQQDATGKVLANDAHKAEHNKTENDPAVRHWRQRSTEQAVESYYGKLGPTTTRSIRVTTRFNAKRTEALRTLASSGDARSFNANISKTTVLLATLNAFLYRVSGQDKLTIGSPTAYRSDPAYKTTCGPFFEVLPLHTQVDEEDAFTDILRKSRAEIMGWIRYAGEDASEEAGQSSISVVLNYIFASMTNIGDISVKTTWRHPNHADRHHALRLHVTDWQNTGTLELSFDFNEAYFDESLRQSAIRQWWYLFDAMSSDASQQVAAVNLHPQELSVSKPVRKVTAAGDPDNSPFSCITSKIDSIGHLQKDTTAVTYGKRTMNYSHLLKMSGLIAQELSDLGIGTGDRVCVCLNRSLHLPAVLLGVLKTGAAYVPIDPGFPAERVKFLVRDSVASLTITESTLTPKFEAANAMLQLDKWLEKQDALVNHTNIDVPSLTTFISTSIILPESPAYILYTSGSTGQPKGVVISHAALANYCDWASEFYCSNKPLTFPLFTPLGFDLTITSLFPPLMSGGTIRVYPESSGPVDATLLNVLEDDAVDIVKLTPAHLTIIQDRDFSNSRIRQLIVGGEDLKTSVASRIHKAFDGKILIHNEYGPTEATVGCIVSTYHPDTSTTSVPIGRAVAGMSALILNTALQQQPEGVIGELFLSGPSLAQGYWNQPELTKAAFILEVSSANSVIYRTGDLVRQLPDGQLLYLGRKDNQIKIRGARIEPAEIEAALLTHPTVSACVVTPIKQTPIADVAVSNCALCGIASNVPGIQYNEDGICNICEKFEQTRSRADTYFKSMQELQTLADSMQTEKSGQYDCMVLLSGGKDSTYALARMADMDLSILAFTLDNGFISNEAKVNIKRVCEALNVDHMFGSTQHMNQIFADSLSRHSNVCHGCFKTIYTLSMQSARDMKIPYIVTGLSRGQFFETRLTEEIFASDHISIENIDEAILSARKNYHKVDDAVHRLMDVSQFDDESIFEQVKFIDFYRYCDVDLDEMLDYLTSRIPWVRPSDTGRSTNCLINDVGIFVHKKEQGFHNYSLPYSWDVRLGHKNRDAALDELDDDIDEAHVHNVLKEVGYSFRVPQEIQINQLAIYYVATDTLQPEKARDWLRDRLPNLMLPSHYTQVDAIALTHNGKVDIDRLPAPLWARDSTLENYRAPRNALESTLVSLWQENLKIEQVGIDENFFELGGDSLLAIRIVSLLNSRGYQLKPAQLFENQTIAQLSRIHAEQPQATLSASTRKKATAFSALKPGQIGRLDQLLKNKKK